MTQKMNGLIKDSGKRTLKMEKESKYTRLGLILRVL